MKDEKKPTQKYTFVYEKENDQTNSKLMMANKTRQS